MLPCLGEVLVFTGSICFLLRIVRSMNLLLGFGTLSFPDTRCIVVVTSQCYRWFKLKKRHGID